MNIFQGDRYRVAAFFLLCGFFITPAQAVTLDPARAAGLVPHKALYDIRLSSKKSSAKVANITGTMFYEWQPGCDAWITNHRFDMVYDYVEVPSVRVTSDFSMYEAFDGKSLNFALQRKRGGVLYEEVRGNAYHDETDKDDEAVFSMPDGLVFDLPDGTMFPMRHTLAVLEKIKEGKKFYNVTLFDGSDTDGPVDVNSFLLSPATYTPPEEVSADIEKSLINTEAWKLRLAFFPLNSSDETADYEMSLIFHENGVISDMNIQYSDFSVTQTLKAVEKLEDTCPSDEKAK